MLSRYYAPWELRNMIFAAVKKAGSKGLTRKQICEAVNRQKGTYMNNAIEAMVSEGILNKTDLGRGDKGYFLYHARKKSYKAQPEDFLTS